MGPVALYPCHPNLAEGKGSALHPALASIFLFVFLTLLRSVRVFPSLSISLIRSLFFRLPRSTFCFSRSLSVFLSCSPARCCVDVSRPLSRFDSLVLRLPSSRSITLSSCRSFFVSSARSLPFPPLSSSPSFLSYLHHLSSCLISAFSPFLVVLLSVLLSLFQSP